MTLSQLRRLARRFNMFIAKYERGTELFLLADISTGAVTAPAPMTLEQIELWLDDLDTQADDE